MIPIQVPFLGRIFLTVKKLEKKTYLAFDIDGTIYDSSEIIEEAYMMGIKKFIARSGKIIPVPGYDDLLKVVGIPVEDIFSTLFGSLNRKERLELNNDCNDSFVSIIEKKGGRLIEGVGATLESLHHAGYIMLTASNGRKEYVEAILKSFDLMKYFSPPFLYPGPEYPDKTSIVAYYKNSVSMNNRLVMIGDRFTDRDAASENGIPFIGCAFGHAGEDEVAGSRWVVRSFKKIPEVLGEIVEKV